MASPGDAPVTIGVSTKTYLGHRACLDWLTAVAAITRGHPAVNAGAAQVFVAVPHPVLEAAVRTVVGSGIAVAAQDVDVAPAGAHTGDVPASLLAELGVSIVEVGHAERRADHGETDAVVAAKAAAAQAARLLPLVCVGERDRVAPAAAAAACLAQVGGIAGPLMLAYEPVWAIGADVPADAGHVRAVVEALRDGLGPDLADTPIVYGGSAGPGLLASLRPAVDGLFLGRFAHDPVNVAAVLDEVAGLARGAADRRRAPAHHCDGWNPSAIGDSRMRRDEAP